LPYFIRLADAILGGDGEDVFAELYAKAEGQSCTRAVAVAWALSHRAAGEARLKDLNPPSQEAVGYLKDTRSGGADVIRAALKVADDGSAKQQGELTDDGRDLTKRCETLLSDFETIRFAQKTEKRQSVLAAESDGDGE
jgi:hypothetical protein